MLEDAKGGLFVSRPGEIIPAESHGFYSYDAKYIDDDGAALTVPAELPPEVETKIRETAALAFRALGYAVWRASISSCLTEDMAFLVNEVNTIPGCTDISMYAKAMAASGVSYPEVIDRLVEHGFARRPLRPQNASSRCLVDMHREENATASSALVTRTGISRINAVACLRLLCFLRFWRVCIT